MTHNTQSPVITSTSDSKLNNYCVNDILRLPVGTAFDTFYLEEEIIFVAVNEKFGDFMRMVVRNEPGSV